MIPLFLEMAKAEPKLKMNQLGKKERNNIINLLKSFPLTITGYSFDRKGHGNLWRISSKDFDPKTPWNPKS